MMKTIPKVGIISHTLMQQRCLRQAIEECGFKVSVAWLVDKLIHDMTLLNKNDPKATDIWLVDVDTFSLGQTAGALSFEHWLFTLTQPVIFGEGSTYNTGGIGWFRQLKTKLLGASSHLAIQNNPKLSAKYVWVLAASTGGPEAVKQFLDELSTGMGVAFVYAQHIEPEQHKVLMNTVVKSSHYTGVIATHGDKISANTVTLVAPHHQLELLKEGIFVTRKQPWRGDYRPSIDQVVAMVADCFGAQSGVIFFSGMGDDGMTGSRLMSIRGGQVWVQSPETCASDSMPQAIQQAGCVDKVGSPKQLANFFKNYLEDERESVTV